MTQGARAQEERSQIAWKTQAAGRNLAQQRANFEAQMRAMALSDLEQVSARLHDLRRELSAQEGREVGQQEVAEATRTPYRTFQSWESGAVENRDGTGYDRIAQFYSRKLGRKITRQWLVFGDTSSARDSLEVSDSDQRLGVVLENQAKLLAAAAALEIQLDQVLERLPRQQPPGRRQGSHGQ